jgi:hypothetical protein
MMNPVRVPERPVPSDDGIGPDSTGPDSMTGADGLGSGEVSEKLPPLTGAAELFHQLNNQLGIILANAELLELKARDETSRARAAQVVSSVLEALQTARTLRQRRNVVPPRAKFVI